MLGPQVVVLDIAGNLPGPLGANYSEFPNSCLSPINLTGI